MSTGRKMKENQYSQTTADVLAQEEYHGAQIAFRFRIGFFFLGLVSVTFNSLALDEIAGIIANFLAIGAYGVVIIISYFVLRSWKPKIMTAGRFLRLWPYITLIFDYLIIFALLMFWQFEEAPDNPLFSIKNPILWFFLFPIALSVFQFRSKLIYTGLVVFLLIYSGLMIWAYAAGVPVTDDWRNYVLGEGMIPADVFTSRVIAYTALCLSLAYSISRALLMVRRIATTEAQKGALSRYFSPEVAGEIQKSHDALTGKRQKVSILFSDIRNFTAISENMDPEQLADFLGTLRQAMIDSVFKHNGTVDKFIGDAVMATFGTPHPSENTEEDTNNSVNAAFAMADALNAFNRSEPGRPEIKIGIGIHTGEVFAGNVGSGQRLEYTVLGDSVNTASRIESLCKKLNHQIIVSQQVYDELDSRLQGLFARLPLVRVKGKEKPLVVYGANPQ